MLGKISFVFATYSSKNIEGFAIWDCENTLDKNRFGSWKFNYESDQHHPSTPTPKKIFVVKVIAKDKKMPSSTPKKMRPIKHIALCESGSR